MKGFEVGGATALMATTFDGERLNPWTGVAERDEGGVGWSGGIGRGRE